MTASLKPIDQRPDWWDDAACRGKDPAWWFQRPTGGGHATNRNSHLNNRAIAICATCPVRARCLAEAEARREMHGVWGGQWLDAPGRRQRRLRRAS